jgi:hypothetical protein
MKHNKSIRFLLIALVLIVATITTGLVSGALPSLGGWKLFTSPLAPPPSEEAARGLQTSPLGTPVPLPEKQATALPVATIQPTVPPPDGWPTDVPWPPPPQTPQPTSTPCPFPTPVLPSLTGKRPSALQTVWFPYYPAPGSEPQMRAVSVDQQGQQWAQLDSRLDLALPAPNVYGPDPGPVLLDLHLSPNGRWLVADFAYTGSRLVDLSSAREVPLLPSGSVLDQWYFCAWHPDGQHALISTREGLLLSDLASQEYEVLDYYSYPEFEHAQVSEIAYSPDGHWLADAVVYSPVYGDRENWMVEIGLREGEGRERKPILQMPALAVNVTSGSLRWSPREHKFIWIMYIVPEDSSSEAQVQLWVADATRGKAEMLATLGEVVEYVHPAVWSPDGRYIAALKIEGVQDGKDSASNIYVLDPESGAERQITHFVDWRLSHLTWSPDGQWLAFTVSRGEYGEIWVTNLDGTQQYPVAGPTLPDAPFVWLPAKGGK